METNELKALCRLVREDIVTMTNAAGSGHPGGSLSATEIMVALYFGGIMHVDPKQPEGEGRGSQDLPARPGRRETPPLRQGAGRAHRTRPARGWK